MHYDTRYNISYAYSMKYTYGTEQFNIYFLTRHMPAAGQGAPGFLKMLLSINV